MNYKKFLVGSLAYISTVSLIPMSVSANTMGKSINFTGMGQVGYIKPFYYDNGELNIQLTENSDSNYRQIIWDFENGTVEEGKYKLHDRISTEEYLIADENYNLMFKKKNSYTTVVAEDLEEELRDKIREHHGYEYSNATISRIYSTDDEIWHMYSVVGVNHCYVGYISETGEIFGKPVYTGRAQYEEMQKRAVIDSRIAIPRYDYKIGEFILTGNRIINNKGEEKIFTEEYGHIIGVDGTKIIRVTYANDAIEIFDINNGNPVLVEEIEIGKYGARDNVDVHVDFNNDIWVKKEGKVYKAVDGKLELRYEVDSDLMYMEVYDENNMVFTSAREYGRSNSKTLIISNGQVVDGVYRWEQKDGKYYLYDLQNTMQTGWVKVNGTYYYMDLNGVMQANRWIGNYFVKSNGAMATNQWVGDYYVNHSGEYVKNQWVGNYYCGADGKYMKNSWVGEYYVNHYGEYVKNQWVAGYYCGSDGRYLRNQWVNDKGSWYYCDNQGLYLYNTSRNINGKTYKFNSNGVCLNP